ncbi:MAG: GNAT family N-acetyltransferase [Rhodospirillaceae bacterium]|nr:GNAT family N-acetyltransferase [Rhodospirillaceae bacterium]
MASITIRKAIAGDAAEIARLANRFGALEGEADDIFSAAIVMRDGFGPKPAFDVLLAEQDSLAVGYALFDEFYNSEIPGRGIWLSDLFVDPDSRGKGLGKRLMAAVASEAVARGCVSLWWGVRNRNAKARAFYETLGVRDDDARILELNGAALERVAATAD